MSIVIDWGDADDTFVIWRFDGHWTWDHLYTTLDELRVMTENKPTFDVMLDLRKCQEVQPNLLSHILRITKALPENYRNSVVVANNGFLAHVHQMVQSQVRMQGETRFVKTIDEAYNIMVSD